MPKRDAGINAVLATLKTPRKGGKKSKSGGGSRKIGRYGKHPSSVRYKAEKRWEKNKARRIATHARRMARKAAKRVRWRAKTRAALGY